MSIQKVFDDDNLKEYIFSFIYSLDHIVKNDLVHILAIHETNPKFMDFLGEETVNLAAEYESINILKWLVFNRKLKGTEYAIDIAASTGNTEILDFLHMECNEGCSPEALLYAAEKGNVAMLIWLGKQYLEQTESPQMEMKKDQFDKFIEWISQQKTPSSPQVLSKSLVS